LDRRSEPLEHPGIAHLVRAIVQVAASYFLKPAALCCAAAFTSSSPCRNFSDHLLGWSAALSRTEPRHPGAFELALEGLRAARLSGFFTASIPGFAKIRTFLGSRLSPQFFPPWMSMAG